MVMSLIGLRTKNNCAGKGQQQLAFTQDEHIIGVGKEYGRKDGRR
jgi:hypothetical protein